MKFEDLKYLDIFRINGKTTIYIKCICYSSRAKDALGCIALPGESIVNLLPDIEVEYLGNMGSVIGKACK